MRHHQSRLIATIIISIFVHLLLAVYTPDFLKLYALREQKEEIIEIQRVDVAKKKEVKPKKEIQQKEEKETTKVGKKESLSIPSSVEKVIDGKIKEIKLGEKFTPPPPMVELPEVSKEPTIVKSPVTFKKFVPPEEIERFEPEGSALIGSMFGKKKDLEMPKIKAETKFHIKKAVIANGFKAGKKEVVGKEPELKIRERNLQLGLKGEIIDRNVDNKPELPSADIDVTTTIILDFEVQPDGTVVKIKPQKRVDVNLERIAMDYLKKWKFSNLPLDAAQKNQKGTLVMKFELE